MEKSLELTTLRDYKGWTFRFLRQKQKEWFCLEVLKINNRILSIKAILSPPKRPPNNLFRTPRAAKSASLVNAFPAREIH